MHAAASLLQFCLGVWPGTPSVTCRQLLHVHVHVPGLQSVWLVAERQEGQEIMQNYPEHQLFKKVFVPAGRWAGGYISWAWKLRKAWLGEAALVQAALVCAEHREAQQVCMTVASLSTVCPIKRLMSLHCAHVH